MKRLGLLAGVQIDPWGSSSYQDYAKLRDTFGIAGFGQPEWSIFPDPHSLFRRGVVFGHRDFQNIVDAVKGHDPWSVMTGFMPSGDLHLGHKMVLEQVVAHQKSGADVHLALADYEAMAARGFTQEKAHRIALDQYVHNALALGLESSGRPFYYQTSNRKVQDLAQRFARSINWATLTALYGFSGETTLGHAFAPIVQAADILHPQLDAVGPRPVLVPVGVDQDPHIRLSRDLAYTTRRISTTLSLNSGNPRGNLGIFVKGDEDVKPLLDLVEQTLRAEGYGEIKRQDSYKAIYVSGPTTSDQRRINLALAQAEAKNGWGIGLTGPSATFHRFQTGLTGGKMSSSKPETSVYLTEDPKSAEKKVRSAVTGGRASAEEQRRLGADPTICPVYELYLYHLAKDDAHLQEVHDTCRSGARLCGGCKSEAIGLLLEWMKGHKERRDQVAHQVAGAVRPSWREPANSGKA